uniref:Variant surface glycoprotein 1125.2006 n=1 Tax=Trypanosoma brucei TaxID=5691 RepID=A0A1J0R810_9TRYP|nr:variant surface glycoprotein 1125.2006 [Trypanosoma brucei]
MVSEKMFLLLVAAVALLNVLHPAEEFSAGDNTNLFLDLCELIALPTRKLPELPDTNTAETDFQQIVTLNASLSGKEWRNKFEKSGDSQKERPQYKAEGGKVDEVHQTRWGRWVAAEDALEHEKGSKATVKAARLDDIGDEEREEVLWMLQPIAEAAAAQINELAAQTEFFLSLKTAPIKAKLALAAFGPGIDDYTKITDAAMGTNNGGASSRQLLCGAIAPTTGKVQTLAGLLYCLCTAESAHSSGTLKVCTSEQDAATAAKGSLTRSAADLKNIISKCPAPSEELVTPQEILSTLATFIARAKPKENYIYFGDLSDAGCTGESQSGICVVYKTTARSDAKDLYSAPWRTNLLAAADMLQKQLSAAAEIKRLATNIAELKKQAFNLRPQLELRKKITSALISTASKGPTQSGTRTPQAKGQCETINKATECRQKQPSCEWKGKNDEDEEHCKLNETHVAQQAPAQAGSGGNGMGQETEKCSEAKTSEDCAKVTGNKPEGKKVVCGWIYNTCKDFSFHLNKKFFLIDAEFMSLEAF